MWNCVRCGAQNEYVEPRCRACGAPRPADETPAKHCVRCGRRFPARYEFCGACGVKLEPLPPLPVAGDASAKRGPAVSVGDVLGLIGSVAVPVVGVFGGLAKMRAGESLRGLLMILLGGVGCVLWWLLLGDYLYTDYWDYMIRPF